MPTTKPVPTTMADLVVQYPTVFTPYKPDDGPICAAFGSNGERCAELAGHQDAGLGHLFPTRDTVYDDPGDEYLYLEEQFFGGGDDL